MQYLRMDLRILSTLHELLEIILTTNIKLELEKAAQGEPAKPSAKYRPTRLAV